MSKERTTEAQKRASRAWEVGNRRKATIDNYKRTARLFINKHSDLEELEELEELITERRKELNKDQE